MNGNIDDYLDAGKEAFTTALAEAKEVYADGNAMQDEVNTAWMNLLDAMSKLMLKPSKELLDDLIAQAEGLNAADYEAESFSVLTAALASAKAVSADENASQDEIDASASDLQDAIAKLTTAGGGTAAGGDDQQSGASGDNGQAAAGDDRRRRQGRSSWRRPEPDRSRKQPDSERLICSGKYFCFKAGWNKGNQDGRHINSIPVRSSGYSGSGGSSCDSSQEKGRQVKKAQC